MKYFKDYELECPITREYKLAEGFGERLDLLRESYGKPIIITSGARSKEHNKNEGGHPRSLHVYDYPYHPTGGCCAVDISITNGVDRLLLIEAAIDLGFSIGVASNFIHVDDRTRVLGLTQRLYVY